MATQPINRLNLTAVALGLGLATTVVSSASAQSGPPPWNRVMQSATFTPSTTMPGKWNAKIEWFAEKGGTTAPINLGAKVVVMVNNPSVAFSVLQPAELGPGGFFCGPLSCTGGCGTGYVDGVTAAALLCLDLDNDGDCNCTWPSITTEIPDMELAVGDEITAILYPAPGALPEPFDDDDVIVISADDLCLEDINGDGFVNGGDLGLLLGAWGSAGPGDLDGNGVVNGADIGLMLGAWGACFPT